MEISRIAALAAASAIACALGACAGNSQPPTDASPHDVSAVDAHGIDVPTGPDVFTPDVPTTYPDGAPIPPCNPDGGIQCDGNWVGHCTPSCGPTQCCSPQQGQFRCTERDANGRCPAADLFVDAMRVMQSRQMDWREFQPTDCEIVEGCVDAPGVRRLLHFDTRTPNTGTADMYLGQPSRTNPNFEFSSCHNHYHFNSYARYELRSAGDGSVAAHGHKQAFCLEDLDRYDPMAPNSTYTCGNQGIQMGWADIYSGGLACQWVDITNVPAGDYILHIEVNVAHILNELNYANNAIDVPVHIDAQAPPDPDPRTACPAGSATDGTSRPCNWTFEGVHHCTAGTMVNVGCSAACSLGSCTGDSMIRVYDGDRTAMGSISFTTGQIASNDDSGCAMGDLCSRAQFMCPTDGTYSVLWSPYHGAATDTTCTIATSP